MGLEARCHAHWGEQVSEGKALLETDDVIFRGEFRVRVLLREVTRVEDAGDDLRITSPAGVLTLTLGAKEAARWAERIRNPRTLLDKLGVKAGQRILWVGPGASDAVREQVVARGADVALGVQEALPGSDLIFLFAESLEDLSELPALVAKMARNGGIWIVAPKGQRHITEMHVLQAGREAGLTDNKVARFSETHTAHKFVIPVDRRSGLPKLAG